MQAETQGSIKSADTGTTVTIQCIMWPAGRISQEAKFDLRLGKGFNQCQGRN